MNDEEKLELIRDKMRGGPRRKIEEFATAIDVTYEELMEHCADYLEHGEYWSEGPKFDGVELPNEFWNWYELVTNNVVPADKRWSFFSCSC